MKDHYTTAEVAEREMTSARVVRRWCDLGKIYYCTKDKNTGEWMILKNYHIIKNPVGRPRKKAPRWSYSPSSKM